MLLRFLEICLILLTQIKVVIVYLKPGFKRGFLRFSGTNIKNISDLFRKGKNTYLKVKNFPHTTRISILKYLFIVFFEINQMLRFTIQIRKLNHKWYPIYIKEL